MKAVVAILMVVALVLLAAPAFAAGDAAAGKEVFSKKCASCHGVTGDGNETVAKMLKVDIKPLSSKEIQAKSDADLKKTILEGTGKMKAITGIDAKAADNLVAYVRTLKK